MKIISILFCSLLLINSVSVFCQTLPTFDRQRYEIPLISTIIDSGDFNGDNLSDIFLINTDINNTAGNIYFYSGNGDGTLKEIVTVREKLGGYKYYVINDFNEDGFTDIIYNGILFISNGNGTFKDGVIIETEGYQAISGDVNSDGKIDLVTAMRAPDNGKNRHFLKTYFGYGDGTFDAPVSCELSQYSTVNFLFDSYYLKYLGDTNSDDMSDLIVSGFYTYFNYNESDMILLLGNQNGIFNSNLIRSRDCFVEKVADLNNDGFVDIFTSTAWYSKWYRSFTNSGLGDFSLQWEYKEEMPASSRYYCTGDFNGDEFKDVFVRYNAGPTTDIFLINDHTGKFNEFSTDFIIYSFVATSLDLNTDGFDDFVASCRDSSFIEVFINKGKNDSSVSGNKPQNFTIFPNTPNPFNSSTSIKIQLKKNTFVKAEIYNLLGQKVKTLISDYMKGGIYNLTWNGTNDSGITLSNGTYILIVKTSGKIKSERLLYLK